ncbi:MAG: efflux RND transporter periplasmic adaptor subunit [Acidobacteria bacterium]|nr:efflux RND transporter periplasmic adaptor subunit [Acidobacteriota bacterium]
MKQNRHKKSSRTKKLWVAIVVLAVVGAGIRIWKPWSAKETPIEDTAEVTLGDYIDYVELRGEITVQSSTLIRAPYNAGDLQILTLARNGTPIRKGDVVVEFDPSSLERIADQFRSALEQAEAEIDRLKAQQSLAEEKNLTEAMSARFALERARLDAGTREVIPAIEHEKNVLAVAKAEQRVRELKTKMESSRIGAEANLAGAIRKRDKALADLEKAKSNLADLTLRSPIDGTITLLSNSRARTSILGGSSPLFKEGDRLWAGASIAEIPDITTIQATAPVFEAERGRIELGQPILLRIEAIPDKEHLGTVRDISPIAQLDYSSYPVKKSFELNIDLIDPDPRLKAGMTATVQVEVERLPDSIMIPVEAVFDKNNRIVAYAVSSNGYEERTLQLTHRGRKYVRVADGLEPGEKVSLKDPDLIAQSRGL